MPTYKNPFDKGNLFINFTVVFPPPNWLSADKLAELKKVDFSSS
jgi:DnaJ family protein A protein 2